MQQQWAVRRIAGVGSLIGDRAPHFGNVDRLNSLLDLLRIDLLGHASVAGYSRILRSAFSSAGGRANPDRWEARERMGEPSSIRVLFEYVQAAGRRAHARRAAPGKVDRYRAVRAAYEEERRLLGLPGSPRGAPRITRAQGSVRGKTIADFPWLMAE